MIFVIIALAFVLRFYQLSGLPPALDWDEASTAYNAYSVFLSGRDEYGQSLPFLFRAFDGYVPPVLVYLNIPFVAVFGLDEFPARLPSTILGMLSVAGVYILVKEIFKSRNLAGFSALFLAISPWHVTYSRVNFFAGTPIAFIIFGAYFFFRGLSKRVFLIASCTLFILAVFSYFSAYIFVPLFALSLVIWRFKQFKIYNAILFLTPIFLATFVIMFAISGGQSRYKNISTLSDADILRVSSQDAIGEGLVGKVVHNRRLVFAQRFMEGYFSYFRFDFLFGKADEVKRMVVPGFGFGLLYFWDLPFLAYGIYLLMSKKPLGWQPILLWLFLSPIAAAPTLPQMTSTRTVLMIPSIAIISAYGFRDFAKNRGKIVVSAVILLLGFNFFIFAHNYFEHFKSEKSESWFYGYKQLFAFLNSGQNVSRKVYFVFKRPDVLDQVYIFLLFYNKVNPKAWQENGGTRLSCGSVSGDFSFDRYSFVPYNCLSTPINWSTFGADDLIVTSKSLEAEPTGTVKFLNGQNGFFVYKYSAISNMFEEVLRKEQL